MVSCPHRPPAKFGWLLLVLATTAQAQPVTGLAPQDRAFLERLALARARTLDQVWALPLKTNLTVGNWVSRDVSADRALRLWCRSLPCYARARFYADGTCDVDVRLSPAMLRQQLATLLLRYPVLAEGRVGERDLTGGEKDWPVLWSTGSAALSERSQTRQPDGWGDVTYEGIQVTSRAAAADARYALFEQAGRLKVTAARHLHEFLESDEAVAEAVHEALQRVATVTVECALDQVAVAEARIGLTDLIRILTKVHQQHYTGDVFHAADFREMALLADRAELKTTGLAVPPSRYLTEPEYQLIDLDTPRWAAQTLSATGRYEPADEDDFAQVVRLGIARFDGMDHLRRKVEALVIQQGVTVEEFIGHHRELKDEIVTFLSGTRVVGRPQALPDGGIQVQVELPLKRLWLIVRAAMQRVEVDPPEEPQPTAQPSAEETP
ncbi:MAG TPA: hypothetical protein VM487_08355 [Phycisphaerae bacterium]|nr:hypothetical protein [Phycisphaerae bacterium]